MTKSLGTRRRTWIIAGVAGALVVGSAVAASAAFTGAEGTAPVGADTVNADRDDDRDDDDDDRPVGESAEPTIGPADAADIALDEIGSAYVTSVEFDDEDGRLVWEIDAVDSDQVDHDVTINAVDGTVLSHEKEHDDADRRDYDVAAAATVTLRQAVDAALAEIPGGTVIDVDLHGDEATPRWEVEVYNEADQTWQYVEIDGLDGSVLSVNDDYSVSDDDDDHDDDQDDDRDDD